MNQISIVTVNVTTAGGAGVAVGSAESIPLNGFLLDAYINYDAGAPATTDVTISDATFGTVLAKANSASKAWYAPRKQTCDPAAADTGSYDLIPLNGPITVSVAGCDALTDAVSVTLRFVEP